MPREVTINLEITIIDELAKLGLETIRVDHYGIWKWLEKEIHFEGKDYLVGAYIKRDEMTRALEIYGQQCLPKQ
jgi:hypothetical protein